MRALEESDPEVSFILQYMNNSAGAHNLTVEGVYKVSRPADEEAFAEKMRKRAAGAAAAAGKKKGKKRRPTKDGRVEKKRVDVVAKKSSSGDSAPPPPPPPPLGADALNRRLLWHGSKAANLLGILHSGLLTRAPHAPISGKSYGDGLYTADVFDKSWGFCFDWRSKRYQGSRYMLLCDVALGKVGR